jgi:predicted PurR-regulated permease PerM
MQAGPVPARASADRPPRVEITVGLRTLVLFAAVVAVCAAVVSISDAIVIVFIGIFIGLVLESPTRIVMRRTGLGRGLAATIVVLGSALALTLLALVLLVPFVGSVRDFLQSLPSVVDDLQSRDALSFLGTGSEDAVQEGAQKVAGAVPDAIAAVLGLAGAAASAALTAFTVLFLALFFVIDMPKLQGMLSSVLMPNAAERAVATWERITDAVSRWAVGAAIIAVAAGTVQGTTAWLLGSSFALALGIIAGFLDLIPTIGATIAGFILVPTLLAEEGLTAALVMLVVIVVYQQVENNLITPKVQSKAVEISAFFVILSVTLFGALLGVLGALVAVPVTAAIQIILREITAERRAQVAAARAGAAAPDTSP